MDYYNVWDEKTAEEFALGFGLEVKGFSQVDCASLQEANKLLESAGFGQLHSRPYYWERNDQIAITHESGMIVFRRRPTSQERSEQEIEWTGWEKRKRGVKR